MASKIDFSSLEIGQYYSRIQLAAIWRYNSYQGFSRGVFTPKNSNKIVLFVTKDKQISFTQYQDYITENFLYWEGEAKGGSNSRIINAKNNKEEIHLFYRKRHHDSFEYRGLISLMNYFPRDEKPYEFIFQINSDVLFNLNVVMEESLKPSTDIDTERISTVLSRIGQGKFRIDLLKLWGGCSVTDCKIPEILKASHIRPWRNSTHSERLDKFNGLLLTPNIDALFDRGLITFENDGYINFSKRLDPIDQSRLQVLDGYKLRIIFEENKNYLRYHRDTIFISK
jgi:putative restriction endonuclease